jgi:hypothetical protein
MTGLDDFKLLLREFRNLAIWAAGGSVALPFIASFISVIPPFPTGLNIMTAVFQLVALVFVYQRYSGEPWGIITRNMGLLFVLIFVSIIGYMILFSMFTIYVPPAKRSIVIGYECTADAAKVYGDKCPFLNLQQLASVAYDEFELWTKLSISVTRALLIALWIFFFICLAALLGKFLVYQMRRRVRRKPTGAEKRSAH